MLVLQLPEGLLVVARRIRVWAVFTLAARTLPAAARNQAPPGPAVGLRRPARSVPGVACCELRRGWLFPGLACGLLRAVSGPARRPLSWVSAALSCAGRGARAARAGAGVGGEDAAAPPGGARRRRAASGLLRPLCSGLPTSRASSLRAECAPRPPSRLEGGEHAGETRVFCGFLNFFNFVSSLSYRHR